MTCAGDIYGMVDPPMRLSRLAEALTECKAKLPDASLGHYLFQQYYSCPVFSDRFRTMPRASIQKAYDALWSTPMSKDLSRAAEEARAQDLPQLATASSLGFLSLIFVTFATAILLQPALSSETKSYASVMYEASREAFNVSERREQPTYAIIEALISQAEWLKLSGAPSQGIVQRFRLSRPAAPDH